MNPEINHLKCPESFADMKEGSFGRHCTSCQTPVVDVTDKSWDEIYAMRLKHGDHFCGAFTDDQFRDIARFRRPISYDLKKGFIMTSIFLALGAQLRGDQGLGDFDLLNHCASDSAEVKQECTTLVGRIHNDKGEPVEGAHIWLKSNRNVKAVTNAMGEFVLHTEKISKDLIGDVLWTHAPGLMSPEIILTEENVKHARFMIHMKRLVEISEAVIVTNSEYNRTSLAGVPPKPPSSYGGVVSLEAEKMDRKSAREYRKNERKNKRKSKKQRRKENRRMRRENRRGEGLQNAIHLDFTSVKVHEQKAVPNKVITGCVFDETGEPLPFANVIIREFNLGTVTDFDGNYRFELSEEAIKADSIIVEVSYVGYVSLTQTLTDLEAVNQLDFKMDENNAHISVGAVVYIEPTVATHICGAGAGPIDFIEGNFLLPQPATIPAKAMTDFKEFKEEQYRSFMRQSLYR
ncbi:carboxypeptidase-like regulatory domain-containing protein [Sanyastnella coralliicola]|uniref:carboxypeptidase-like regulatory domain-containing protein n=1 Tax=Sanyastnella coralliicola TaxID=3069118 RepID=UPI0027B94AB6|nr:carboxypeptidase-like regulatory domain-containing protein [Longitalea sp. SCSIO 12813]